ncbi:MAG: hypothetical protein EAZ78_24440 [Oscillatoriales cyanobacterium]|nr:MAG: hypothetical protein EAZ98_18350 [Oscillatoriales cyanobacterium]TAE01947.1 MAG: hypothetical protein EAZ96_17450 [Oscillatoriales cyanobacterium]TAE98291.1 MAG: hypothetical protein EAZ78_24440 [Oscillatoriales cyanobacterium]TAF62948.1 MAG: hypothetical protein EAZ59_22005 [Oscillatoriales cyanobacterium]
MIAIEAPALVILEAKQADLKTGIGQRFTVGWGRVFEIVDYRQLLLANPPLPKLCLINLRYCTIINNL